MNHRPPICVVVAFHKPALALAARQIESLLAQSNVALTCIAVLDGPETAENEELRALLTHDNVTIVATSGASGIRRAFATGLKAALLQHEDPSTSFAYCDQDDVWYPDKLRRSIDHARATGASLVHCDARIIDEAGIEIARSLHRYESRVEPHSLLETLLLNAMTGMSMVFTAGTARLALAMMEAYDGELLHDHITAVAAAAVGQTALLDVPLLDYVQHRDNQVGAKVHRSAWRRRAFGILPLSLYRQTSSALFAERRALCLLLAAHSRLPPHLARMFVVERQTGATSLGYRYTVEVGKLLAGGQSRRAMLCLRMMDAAFRYRRGFR